MGGEHGVLGHEQGRGLLIMTRTRGFTLVEMVVVLAILAVLLGLGLPSYRTYMANQRIRSAAEVFMAGLQMARGEAVKLNQRVEFAMTNEAPTVASVDTTNTSTTGRNWIVRGVANAVAADLPNRALVAGGNTFVEGKSGAEGGGAASSANSPIIVTGSLASIAFDGYGMPIGLTTTATFDFSSSSGTCVAPATTNCTVQGTGGGEMRCLQLRLSRGGQARLCDPATLVGDTRNCCQ